MAVNGVSYNYQELVNKIENSKLDAKDKANISLYLETANTDDNDTTTVSAQEMSDFIGFLQMKYKEKCGQILSALGINGSSNSESSSTEYQAQQAVEAPDTGRYKAELQEDGSTIVTDYKTGTAKTYPKGSYVNINNETGEVDVKLPAYLENDLAYKKYSEKISKLDNYMKKIEEKYNVQRGNLDDELNIPVQTLKSYSKAKVFYEIYAPMLKEYESVMSKWQDGSLGEKSMVSHSDSSGANDKYTNIERITLKNGQRAYRADHNGSRAVFYPYWDGSCGGPEVEDKSLIP